MKFCNKVVNNSVDHVKIQSQSLVVWFCGVRLTTLDRIGVLK